MYAFFGIGAMFAPIIIGVFVDKGIMWSKYYYAPLTLSITLAILGYIAFKDCKSCPLDPLGGNFLPRLLVWAPLMRSWWCRRRAQRGNARRPGDARRRRYGRNRHSRPSDDVGIATHETRFEDSRSVARLLHDHARVSITLLLSSL